MSIDNHESLKQPQLPESFRRHGSTRLDVMQKAVQMLAYASAANNIARVVQGGSEYAIAPASTASTASEVRPTPVIAPAAPIVAPKPTAAEYPKEIQALQEALNQLYDDQKATQ